MPCPEPGRGRQSSPVSGRGKATESPPLQFWLGGCGFREGTPRLQGSTLSPLPSSNTSGKRDKTPPAPAPYPYGPAASSFESGGPGAPGPCTRSPDTPDLPALGPAKRPRRAPPEPPGKMAPAEQLRHQPWRRARPSAILAPSNRSPTPPHTTPQEPASGAIRGEGENRVRPAHSRPKECHPASCLFRLVARAPKEAPGWAVGPPRGAKARQGPAAGRRRCFGPRQRGDGEGPVQPAGAHRELGWTGNWAPGRGGRPAPSSPCRGPARPRSLRRGSPQERREGGGSQDEK